MCAREGHPTEGPDARRARSAFDAALSEATKRGQRLTRTDTGVRLRSKETIEAASRARQRWQAHLDGTEGPDELLIEVLRCWLLEAPLESWPEAWTLIEGERALTWDGFDLNKALIAWARRISGLRFREDAPHVAPLLHAAGAMDALALIAALGSVPASATIPSRRRGNRTWWRSRMRSKRSTETRMWRPDAPTCATFPS